MSENYELQPIGLIKGKVSTIDADITNLEMLVESNQVEQMITICVEKGGPLHTVHIMTHGASLDRTKNILEVALNAVEETIRKAQ